jgi:hypothetical protein
MGWLEELLAKVPTCEPTDTQTILIKDDDASTWARVATTREFVNARDYIATEGRLATRPLTVRREKFQLAVDSWLRQKRRHPQMGMEPQLRQECEHLSKEIRWPRGAPTWARFRIRLGDAWDLEQVSRVASRAGAVLRRWANDVNWALSTVRALNVNCLLAIRRAARGRLPKDILMAIIALANRESFDV